jgi:ribosome-associated protein
MSKKQTNRDKNLSKILEEVTYARPKITNSIAIKDDPLYSMIETVIAAADNRKAGAITALRINHLTEITTFMVIVEGNSRPQISAIALSIEDDVLVQHQQQPSKQGVAESGWILLDYGSVIVHVMTPQIRQFYKLEKRWKDAENVDISSMIVADRVNSDDIEDNENNDQNTENNDPFWN